MRSVRRWIVLFVVVLLVAGSMYLRESSLKMRAVNDAAGAGPESAVTAMLVAQRDGDLQMFRNCLAGPALEEVNSAIERRSSGEVATELRSVLQGMKGYAVTRRDAVHEESASTTRAAADSATVDLELIFADYTVQQSLQLQRIEDVWRIVDRSEPDRTVPEIRYGTPVNPALTDEGTATARR